MRRWRESDKELFAELNADPIAMEHFPSLLTREQSDAAVERFDGLIAERGWGLWAVEVVDSGDFIGFVGLNPPPWDAHFTPAVEIGWRLRREHWGKGYATEAAREALRFAFEDLDLDEIVSFTTPANTRSRAVMERLGMTRNVADDFEHPNVEVGHPMRLHVLYRLKRSLWQNDAL
jgi:RimJ/RimL family protein N-acetyltransferase